MQLADVKFALRQFLRDRPKPCRRLQHTVILVDLRQLHHLPRKFDWRFEELERLLFVNRLSLGQSRLNERLRFAKDTAAWAVFVVIIAAALIVLTVFVPRVLRLIEQS